MQISRMFPEQLSRRHAVNIPLLPADVQQHWCPRVTLNRSFRWSLLYYTTDILEKLFPGMCENCQWGVSFIGKTGSKQRIYNENMHCKELPFAASGYVCVILLHSVGSRSQHCFPLPNQQCDVYLWLWVNVLLFSRRVLTCLCYSIVRGMLSFWFE